MSVFKKFKKSVKRAVKRAGKIAKKTPQFKQVRTIRKIVRGKARRRLRLSDVFGLTTIQGKRKPITITNVRRPRKKMRRKSNRAKRSS